MLLSLKNWRTRPTREVETRTELKARIRRIFGLDPDDVIKVNEIVCFDPACPDVETIVLVMRTGERTCAVKSPLPMVDLDDAAIECLAATWRRSAAQTLDR